MASVAVERPVDRDAGDNRAWIRGVLLLAVAALIWGAWEGFRALRIHYGWTRPFTIDATTMPHIHSMIKPLFERPNPEAPLLIVTLLRQRRSPRWRLRSSSRWEQSRGSSAARSLPTPVSCS